MTGAADAARQMWVLAEPVHAVTYFSDEGRAAFAEAGLRGFWRGYFAGRAAPLGPVGPAPVIASFFTFAPAMVTRALPAVWDLASPEEALRARSAGATAALRRLLDEAGQAGTGSPGTGPAPAGDAAGGLIDDISAQVSRSADGLSAAMAGVNCAGRVLAAANAALPVPDEPLARLWQAATVLREHRGDGHFAALVAAGLDGCEATVLRACLDGNREVLQPVRGWTDQEWDQAADALAGRGWLAADGTVTPAGHQAHREVEAATDRAASRPWQQLGPAGVADLAGLLAPIARACRAALPFPNPIGLPARPAPAP
jgi:hypothetical protein